jgi:purine-nucleoside phosphorylase
MPPHSADRSVPDLYSRVCAAADFIRLLHPERPALGIVLGSGLGSFAGQVEGATVIDYGRIPGWPVSTVDGHYGRLVMGTIASVRVAVMQGRVHAYEGYSMEQVTFPTRVLGLLGCRALIVTNAAGGINTDYAEGALVAISDHINLTGSNAAAGPNEPRFGVCSTPEIPAPGQRFFDMSAAYSPRLRTLAQAEAERQKIALHEGVYLAVLGPSFETPAEIRAFRILGADLVGMSTVHEVIVARHMGMEVLGISLVTNMAAGVVNRVIQHEDVMEIGRKVEVQFTSLLRALVPQVADTILLPAAR